LDLILEGASVPQGCLVEELKPFGKVNVIHRLEGHDAWLAELTLRQMGAGLRAKPIDPLSLIAGQADKALYAKVFEGKV
jgi:hypothetical protein